MIAHPYAGATDLRLMQEALISGYESTHTRIGDLAWRARYHTHSELSLEIRLWLEGEKIVAWTWLRTRGGLDLYLIAPATRRSGTRCWIRSTWKGPEAGGGGRTGGGLHLVYG